MTFVEGLDKRELLQRFGGELSQARFVSFDDQNAIEQFGLFGTVLWVGQCGEWAFVYEDYGYVGQIPEVLHTISAGTRAVSVLNHEVNGHTWFCYAEDGTPIVSAEPGTLLYTNPSPQVQELLRRAGFSDAPTENDDYDSLQIMSALAEAAGVRLTKEAIADSPLLSTFLKNPFSDFVEDVLSLGADEQTANRLLDLLNSWEHRERILNFFNDGLQRERFPRSHDLDQRWQKEYLGPMVVKILTALQSVQITLPLLSALETANEEMRFAVRELLKILIDFDQMYDQQGARERLLMLSGASEPELALQAALTLGARGDQRAVEPLLSLIPVYPNERKIIQVLGRLQESSAKEPLLRLLNPQSKEIDYQRDLLKALEHIGGGAIADRLLLFLDPEPTSSRAGNFQGDLLKTLLRLHPPHLLDALLALLHPYPGPYPDFTPKSGFQMSLIATLGHLGNRQAIDPLAQLLVLDVQGLSLPEHYLQVRLVEALKQLGDTRSELEEIAAALQREDSKFMRRSFSTLVHPSPENLL
ncbi:hypothetical protein KSF_105830 [Reticulibacter mediterranei]|uniref:HEAT repeat domain-containing protein n=2 Tax=Reticulibacter mediterranei TaxID=2778369 RepID=A0A8J3IY00_9CHLR|nr:hypothetical protein KSF_105830 [Reticulibacter mediterranei]